MKEHDDLEVINFSSDDEDEVEQDRQPEHAGKDEDASISDDKDSDSDEEQVPIPDVILNLLRPDEGYALLSDYTCSKVQIEDAKTSLFQKVSTKGRETDLRCTSQNLHEEQIKKANEMFEKNYMFRDVAIDAKKIKPLNSRVLDLKEKRRQDGMTAGKAWGDMAKVELTEEVKADLRALQHRNQIFPARHYKANDSKKLPEYFQIGTVVDDVRIAGNNVNKQRKKASSIAAQFLSEDQSLGFSKRKYEDVNSSKRRKGEKKRALKLKMGKLKN